MSVLNYSPENNFVHRFVSLAYEGVKKAPTIEHTENFVEKAGNGILYVPENFPRVIRKICTNPQLMTLAVFTTAHLVNSFLFYPEKTEEALKAIGEYLPKITVEMIRFAGWFATSSGITGVCARVGGRLTDSYVEQLAVRTAKIQADNAAAKAAATRAPAAPVNHGSYRY